MEKHVSQPGSAIDPDGPARIPWFSRIAPQPHVTSHFSTGHARNFTPERRYQAVGVRGTRWRQLMAWKRSAAVRSTSVLGDRKGLVQLSWCRYSRWGRLPQTDSAQAGQPGSDAVAPLPGGPIEIVVAQSLAEPSVVFERGKLGGIMC